MDAAEIDGQIREQKATIENIEMLAGLSQSGGTDEFNVFDFEVRGDLLENYWQEFVNRDRTLQRYASRLQDRSYFANGIFASTQEMYLKTRAWINRETRQRSPPPTQPAYSAPANQGSAVVAAQTALESVKLPTFNGSQRDWEPFKEKFVSLVLDDATMSDVIKFQRLLNALEGEAADTLHGIKVVAVNFQSAWTTLCERYDNKPLRFSLQMKTLISMPASTRESASHINQLLNTTNEAINNFRELGRPIDQWDDILIHFLESKLPTRTRMDWVKAIEREKLGDFPRYDRLKKFLQDRVRSLELVDAKTDCSSQEKSKAAVNNHQGKPTDKQQKKSQVLAVSKADKRDNKKSSTQCSLCEGPHFLAYCAKFSNLPLDRRKAHIEAVNLCSNCLNNHKLEACISKKRCFVCGGKHHTKIHQDKQISNSNQAAAHSSNSTNMMVSCSSQTLATTSGASVMLSTACVTLESPAGKRIKLRALLDSCSEESFITSHAAQALQLKLHKAELSCSGLGETKVTVARRQASATLRSDSLPEFALKFSPYVLTRLTSQSPREEINISGCRHLQNIKLADPDFAVPGHIDCLLGSAIFSAVLLDRIRRGSTNQPIALESIFGWIVLGAEGSKSTASSARVLHTVTHSEAAELNKTLTKFWELEEIPVAPTMSPEEQACYAHFKKTHYRNEEGRFVLRLPFRQPPVLPDTLKPATACMNRHFKKFEQQPELAKAYTDFINEYSELGHMELIPENEVNANHVCYIPHHPVFRKDSGKIRVVFNASQRYSNGHSLNSFLHVGPKLQEDVLIIILRWSFYRFVFKCDVVKMFRQFLIHPADRDWQRIVWKTSTSAPLLHFRLGTVSYGEACAPFQSNAAMLQLADDEQDSFPRGATALRKRRYADDFYVGEDTVAEAQESLSQVVQILSSAGMEAGKWASNHSDVLQNVHRDACSDAVKVAHEQEEISTLGLRWNPTKDCFFFRISEPDADDHVSKRSILSEISRLFDPIGFVSAVTIRGKILLQNLWLLKIGWDEPVPTEVAEAWKTFKNQLSDLEAIEIPRWVGTFSDSEWHLHGFCDASERAYAAVLFIVVHNQGQISSKFITAKSKVAPVKAVSLPRLELCGAHLLSRLIAYVLQGLDRTPAKIHCWSDSKIVLAWLQTHSSRWKAFIANRVSEITSAVPAAVWRHVPSADNPADLASRGVSPSQLRESRLWWSGPDWLMKPQSEWPTAPETFHTELEARSKEAHVFVSQSPSEFEQWCARFSFIEKIVRILAFVHRWISKIKSNQNSRQFTWLSAEELAAGRILMFKGLQRCNYDREIQSLIHSKQIFQTSTIRRLAPFLDEQGVLRVGGRLHNSFLTEEEKHPIIVPSNNHIVELLIRRSHLDTLHGGPSLVQSHLARQVWIIRGRNFIRNIVRQCTTCVRDKSVTMQQQMGPLPAVRLRPARPFTYTGVDYAGPFCLKFSPGRGSKVTKSYVAIFVCMVVKAVHIEVVSDLTSAAFLAAFNRFTARRGLPNTMYSDNGTTFQGAESELGRLFDQTSRVNQEIAERLARDKVNWSFIPPRAPNFGGLWEANVCSFKKHLRRVVGDSKLTFEEFSTVAAMIEACLNSRPLSAISAHETDPVALTPGHFLIGAALISHPEPFMEINENCSIRSRWHLLNLMRNHFWARWKREFLSQLQQRSKWLHPNREFKIGDLVLFKDELLPATKWPLARITELHPGADGLCRVVTIKSGTSTYKRPINKLILLPVNEPAENHQVAQPDLSAGGSDHLPSPTAP